MKKKNYVTSGFWTKNGNPTDNSLMAYFLLLKNVPKNWDVTKVHKPTMDFIHRALGIPHHKDSTTIIMWGIREACAVSKTSSQRHLAMSKSFNMAKSMIAQGFELTFVNP